jgi:hypothetical protein
MPHQSMVLKNALQFVTFVTDEMTFMTLEIDSSTVSDAPEPPISVFTQPGCTETTVIPSSANSPLTAFVTIFNGEALTSCGGKILVGT